MPPKLNAKSAANIQRDYDEKKRAQRLGKGGKGKKKVDDGDDDFDDEPVASSKSVSFNLPPPPTPKKGKLHMREPRDDEPPYDDDMPFPEEDEATAHARHVNKCAMINDYYAAFPVLKVGKKVWTVEKDDELKCDIELERIRNHLNGKGSKEAVIGLFLAATQGMEYVTVNMFNPMELDLVNFGAACAQNIQQFEPELTEASIELRHWFAADWKYRLAYKMVDFARTYSALKKNPVLLEQIRQQKQRMMEQMAAKATNVTVSTKKGKKKDAATSDDQMGFEFPDPPA